MTLYDNLLREVPIPVNDDADIPGPRKGLYIDMSMNSRRVKAILLDPKKIRTRTEKRCVLAEELGHHYTTYGDIEDQTILTNRKLERRARIWAHEKLVPLTSIVDAHKAGIRNRHEFADYLQVTEEFLDEALRRYQEKYGLCKQIDKYTIVFEPLGVAQFFDF
ncbi:MAG TPA: ImmA/IrrE family metallo-endopeptidase [Paenibacillus sp.]|nr:ImmA/IrrE family metallo-endopeptidase [Paenibacillus sp.]